MGILYDVFIDFVFCCVFGYVIGDGKFLLLGQGVLCFVIVLVWVELVSVIDEEFCQLKLEQINIGLLFDSWFYFKVYWCLLLGINFELEVGYFFSIGGYFYFVWVVGFVEYVVVDGSCVVLVMVQEFVENQGNVWDYIFNYFG